MTKLGTFFRTPVLLDGEAWEDCSFTECTLFMNGRAEFTMKNCEIRNCSITFDQAAAVTVRQIQCLFGADPTFKDDVSKIIGLRSHVRLENAVEKAEGIVNTLTGLVAAGAGLGAFVQVSRSKQANETLNGLLADLAKELRERQGSKQAPKACGRPQSLEGPSRLEDPKPREHKGQNQKLENNDCGSTFVSRFWGCASFSSR